MPRKILPLALLLCLLPAYSPAQDPPPSPVLKLIAPTIVPIGDLATVSVDPASNAQDVQFTVVPPLKAPTNQQAYGDHLDFVCGADEPQGGSWTVVASGNLNGKTLTATVVVTFGEKPTPPQPTPPGPTPPPAPVASKLWLILVYDQTNTPQAISALVADSSFWYGLATEGHQEATFDAMSAGAKPYVDAAAKSNVSVPFVMFIDADTKKVLATEPLPQTEAAITAEVNALTGKTDKET